MPEARTPTARTEPLRLARTESMLEARPRPNLPGAEEMFLSPRVLDAGAFARYAELLKSLIAEARQGARSLQDFTLDADQMKAVCEKTGEQLRVRLEAGARVVRLIDERADRAEKLIATVREELPTPERVRAMAEPGVRAAVEAAESRVAAAALEAERRARAAASEIEQKLAAMSARAEDQAARLERAGEMIERRLEELQSRLDGMIERAESHAAGFERRTQEAIESADTRLAPVLDRVSDAAASIDETLASAWRRAEERAGQISQRLSPLQESCDAVLARLGLDPADPNPAGSVLDRLDGLVARSERSVRDAERVIGQVEHLRGQADQTRSDFGAWLLEAAAQVDLLEARREKLRGPLAEAAEKVARVSPKLLDDLEMASLRVDQLQTEQAALREAVQASALLARSATADLNNQSAQLKALVDGSVHTLTRRVEEAGAWLGELILRAEAAAKASRPDEPARTPATAPVTPAARTPEPPANSYGLPMPGPSPIDAVAFDGAEIVFGHGDAGE